MKPLDFPEKTVDLQRPSSMSEEECAPLAVHQTNDGRCISCWRPSWRERLAILWHGRVWLQVYAGRTQPPVALTGARTVFTYPPGSEPPREAWWKALGIEFPFTPR